MGDDVRCSKCDKPKFRGRDSNFCSDTCDVTVETPVPTQPSPGHIYKEITEMEESEKDKKYLYQKKKQEEIAKSEQKYAKQKKKNSKQEEREKRRKEKQQRKLEKKNKKFGSAPNSDGTGWHQKEPLTAGESAEVAELGPLGHLIKAIIVANTWQ